MLTHEDLVCQLDQLVDRLLNRWEIREAEALLCFLHRYGDEAITHFENTRLATTQSSGLLTWPQLRALFDNKPAQPP